MSDRRDCECSNARHRHGTYHAYNADRCRCEDCRAAASRQRRLNYRKRCTRLWSVGDPAPYVPVAGTARRLQALGNIGWSACQLAAYTGITVDYLRKLREGEYPTIRPETAAAVTATYDALWDKPLDDASARKVKGMARRWGWLPPLAWDDDEIDDPDALPHTPTGPSTWDHKPCGTRAAYRRHQRNGEQPCEACRKANARREDAA